MIQHVILRVFRRLSFSLLLLLSSTVLFSVNDNRIDSLLNVAENSVEPDCSLKAFRALVQINYQKPEQVYYLQKLLDKAISVDSIQIAYNSLIELVYYYHDNLDMENLNYWTSYIDSMAKARNENPDAYYAAHSCVANVFLYRGLYELSTSEALQMYKKAEQTQQQYGLASSSETLGLIYQTTRRDSDAVVAFQDALDVREKIKEDLKYRVYILSCQIVSYLRMNKLEEASDLLKKHKIALDRRNEYRKQHNQIYKIDYYHWLLYSFYADLYLREGKLEEAKESLDRSSEFYEEGMPVNADYAVYFYFHVKARYYQAIKDYPRALEAIDVLFEDEIEPEDLKMKINILLEQGKYKEATVLYKEILELTEKKKDEAFTQQINQLRTLYDVNDKEIQAKELQISNMKIDQKQVQVTLLSLLMLILLVFLFVLFQYLRRTRRLKNELVNEKKSLIESQDKLKQAKIKAEVANQMKSAFIANISHEIRTPLNAIVGFSTLLAEPSFEQEEKDEFLNVINLNSDLLLNLINDVLDISRMESGNMKFSLQPCDLVQCCKKALNSIEHKISYGVKLTLTTSCESFTLDTDPLRLQQLLLNLLSNAAKFTKEGEINLSFMVDDNKRQVKFMVTDTGTGIPLEKQKSIFERFEKLDEHVQGTGLGLSICRIISERLGGSVFIDSSYTGGARFVFIHPFNQSV